MRIIQKMTIRVSIPEEVYRFLSDEALTKMTDAIEETLTSIDFGLDTLPAVREIATSAALKHIFQMRVEVV